MNHPILGYLRFLVPGVLALTLGCSDSLTSQAEGELPEATGSPADAGICCEKPTDSKAQSEEIIRDTCPNQETDR